MIDVVNLDKYIGGRALLERVSFKLLPGERVALVGANGSGKSTLLKICAGQTSADGGQVSLPKDTTVGYLPQHADMDSRHSLRDALRHVFDEVLSHQEELEHLTHRMGELDPAGEEYGRVADRWGHLHHEVERMGIYEMDANIGRIAAGLGFRNADLERPCQDFSGGWRMRILLARLLLRNPDVLLLDEPTNHLDLETMIWLEDWIRAADSSLMMVSHERAFMDNLAQRVFELHEGQLTIYKGSYSDYLEQREERWAQWEREYTNQQEEIARIRKFIDRFRYKASKAVQVQSRIKQLEKIELIPPPPRERGRIHFRFPPADRGSKEVFVAEGLGMAFGDLNVFSGLDFSIFRGDRVALVGLNGAGKSTLLKLMTGRHRTDIGTLKRGAATTIEYFAQYESEGLGPNNTILNEVLSTAGPGHEQEVRNLLGGFFFTGEDAEKRIHVLSGGERTRVRLCKMLLSGANTLLLDEPTNHLDLASRRTLEEAMQAYQGTLIFVSHDRVFLDRIPTRVFEIKDGRLRCFAGNYQDYCRALAAMGEQSPLVGKTSGGKSGPSKGSGVERMNGAAARADGGEGKPDRQMSREERKAAQREQRRLERAIAEKEQAIAAVEKRQKAIEEQLMMPSVYSDPGKCGELGAEQKRLKAELEAHYREWERLQEQLAETADA